MKAIKDAARRLTVRYNKSRPAGCLCPHVGPALREAREQHGQERAVLLDSQAAIDAAHAAMVADTKRRMTELNKNHWKEGDL